MNKKVITVFGIIIVVVLLIIVASINPNEKEENGEEDLYQIVNNAKEESANVKEEEQKEFKEINVSEYIEMYNGNEKQLVVVGRPTCSYCTIAIPIIKNIAYKYDLNINYLNVDNFEGDDQQTFINSDKQFEEGFGTPMLLAVSNGKINDMVDGLTDNSHYVKFFKKHGFIK